MLCHVMTRGWCLASVLVMGGCGMGYEIVHEMRDGDAFMRSLR